MGRIWVIALAIILATWLLFMMGDITGPDLLLTAQGPIGAGVVAAFLIGGNYFSRSVWLLVGLICGALGFVIGASAMTDNAFGLALGATITTTLIALLTFWTRKEAAFLCAILGSGALAGVYVYQFNLDPQSLNSSLPIAMAQALLPLSMGYLFGMFVRILLPDDDEYQEQRAAAKGDDNPDGESTEVDGATDAADTAEISDSESDVNLDKNVSNA